MGWNKAGHPFAEVIGDGPPDQKIVLPFYFTDGQCLTCGDPVTIDTGFVYWYGTVMTHQRDGSMQRDTGCIVLHTACAEGLAVRLAHDAMQCARGVHANQGEWLHAADEKP